MNCTKCGAAMREGARFCTTCGNDTRTTSPEPAAMPPQQPQGSPPQSGMPQPPLGSTPQSGMPQQPGYPQPSQGYPPQPGMTQQPGYPQPSQGYSPQPGMAQQPGYPQPPQGYPPQPGLPQQPGYPQPPQGYPPQPGMTQQPGYPQQAGYPPQNGYPPQQSGYPQAAPPPAPRTRKRRGGCLGVLLLLLLLPILLAGVAFAGYHTIMPAKWVYGVAEYFTINSTYDEVDAELDRLETRHLIPLMEQPFSRKSDMGLSLDPSLLEATMNIDPETASQIADLVSSMTLRTAASGDFQNRSAHSDITVDVQGNPFLGMNVTLRNNVYGLQFPDLSKTRLSMDLSDPAALSRLSALTGTETDPAMMPALSDPWIATDIYDKVGIDRAELKKLVLDYALAAFMEMPSSAMTLERGMEIDLFDEKTPVREITIDMTPEQTKDLVLAMMEKAETDERFYRLFVANLDRLLEIMEQSSPDLAAELQPVRDGLTPEKFEENLRNERLEYADQPITPDADAPELTVKAYVNGYKIVRHAISVTGNPSSPGQLDIGIDRKKSGDRIDNRLFATSSAEEEGFNLMMRWSNESVASSNTQNRTFDFSMDVDSYGYADSYAFSLHSLETPEGRNAATRKVDGLLRVVQQWNDTDITANLEGGGSVERDSQGKTLSTQQKFEISLAAGGMEKPISFQLALDTENTYGGTFTFPTDTQTPLNVATASDEDLQTYANEVMPKLEELMGSLAPGME